MSLKFRIAVGFLAIFTGYLNAQVVAATLRGIVTNVSGAPVPGVKIEIINLGTNLKRTKMTGTGGDFIASNLPPGQYQVSGSLSGFVSFHLEISLTLGEQRTHNIKMAPGHGSEVGGNTAAPDDPQAPTTKVSNVADSSTVRDLPSNGRDWTQAATLQAGVSSVSTQADASNTNSGRGQRGFGSEITVSGARPTQNNYLLNGISTNDYANSAPGSVLGLDLGADAVEQFAVVTSSYPADFGRSSGGILNAITRSGSNAFHGSFYEFLRNNAFDTRNFFDGPKPPFRRNQFGGAVGGPIRKDRSYFFVNYEGLRQSLGVTHIDTVPSPAARAGVLSTGNVTVDAQAAR